MRFALAVIVLLVTALGPVPAHAAPEQFAIDSVVAAVDNTQAGAHADLTAGFDLKLDPSADQAYASLRDARVSLPPGIVGNPTAFAKCPTTLFTAFHAFGDSVCPQDSQIGVAVVSLKLFGRLFTLTEPLYNLDAPDGSPARIGFEAALYPTVIDFRIRSGTDYGLDAVARGANPVAVVSAVKTVTWGVPSDASHDTFRYTPNDVGCLLFGCAPTPSSLPAIPFMANATNCEPSTLDVDVNTYDLPPSQHFTASTAMPTLTGCESVPFDPGVAVSPTSRAAHAPSGFNFDISLPVDGFENPTGLRSADLRKAVVTLPEGMTINPSSVHGLAACSEAQVGLVAEVPPRFNTDGAQCPDASKIGSVQIDTPVLDEPLLGSLYLAKQSENPFHSLLAGYLVAKANGVLLKLAGRFDLDPQTGRVQAIFDNNPQLPFSKLHLEFFGGPHGPLTNPGCGDYTVTSVLDGWNGAQVQRTSQFTIDQGCTPAQFKPQVQAGLANPVAGSSSAFSLRVTRSDADSELKSIQTQLPPGLLAKVAGVPRCSDAQAQAGTCPAESQIGHVEAGAGSGPDPFFIKTGKVFLTDGYKAAPFGLLVQVPAVAGPFDLGVVNVRAALNVDKITAQASVDADPMPRILQGVPLQVRDLRVTIDRPGFMRAPTSCSRMTVGATIGSYAGDSVNSATPFQVGGCSDLPFTPKLQMKLTDRSQTTDGKHPGLEATVSMPDGQANIKNAKVELPLSLALDPDNAQALCEYEDGLKENCPASSIVGHAKAETPLLDTPVEGPVYFVKGVRFDRNGTPHKTLPTLLVPLKGEIDITLRASSEVDDEGKLVTTFGGVPDAPVSKFTLQIDGGRHGILVVSNADVCKADQKAAQQFDGQNGKAGDASVLIATPCALKILSKKIGKSSVAVKVGGLSPGVLRISGKGIKTTRKTLGQTTVTTVTAPLTAAGKKLKSLKVKASFDPAGASPPVATTARVKAARSSRRR